MQHTVKASLKNTLIAAKEGGQFLIESLFEYPGQILYCVFYIMWTETVKELLAKGADLTIFLNEEEVLFESLLKVSKENNLQLKERILVNNLLILKLYHIHIIKTLKTKNTTTLDSFEWLSQLRYELQEDLLTLNSITSTLTYGYEYLGNTKMLVQTPQTERGYQTLFMALNYQLGGHITGPAGAGKTELIKDFAKSLARFLVIFNCSEETPRAVLGSFFKGMAASGSWCCLDEVDRLDYQTMSLISQQIAVIHKRIKANAVEIQLEDSTLKLKPTCAIFITSNPYETRAKISNNLKLRFRPITITVPDIQIILEVILRSHGYPEYKRIAKKLFRFQEIIVDRVSPQDHYEFGLKNLLTIIESASQRHRKTNDCSFGSIVDEMGDFHKPKLNERDKSTFENLLNLMFEQSKSEATNGQDLSGMLTELCERKNLVCNNYIAQKTTEIKSFLENNVPVIVLGEPNSGKTTCISLVQDILLEEAKREVRGFYESPHIQLLNKNFNFFPEPGYQKIIVCPESKSSNSYAALRVHG